MSRDRITSDIKFDKIRTISPPFISDNCLFPRIVDEAVVTHLDALHTMVFDLAIAIEW